MDLKLFFKSAPCKMTFWKLLHNYDSNLLVSLDWEFSIKNVSQGGWDLSSADIFRPSLVRKISALDKSHPPWLTFAVQTFWCKKLGIFWNL